MSYDRLNLANGDLISSSHIHHIEDGIDGVINQYNDLKNKVVAILNDKSVSANNTESISDLVRKISTLRSPQVANYVYEDVIDITKTVRSGQIQIVFPKNGTFSVSVKSNKGFTIDWGDGNHKDYTSTALTSCEHTYADESTQVVCTIAPLENGRITQLTFGAGKEKVLAFCSKDVYFESVSAMFADLAAIKYIDFINGSIGTSDRNFSMESFAKDCIALKRLTGSVAWDRVTSMYMAFTRCQALEELNLGSSWDSRNVTNFGIAFLNCRKLKTIPYFRTDSTTTMDRCFYGCSALQTIGGDSWNLERCTNTSMLFYEDAALVTIPEFVNTELIDTANEMFKGCSALIKLNDNQETLDLSAATNVAELFMNCRSLEESPNLKFDNALNASYLFANCESLSIIPERLEFPNVVGDATEPSGLYGLFLNCMSIIGMPKIVADKCLNISSMYKGCDNMINVDDDFSFPEAKNASSLFESCIKLQAAPAKLNLPNATTFENMFKGCTSLTIAPASGEDDRFKYDNVTNINGIFSGCISLQTPPTRFLFNNVVNGMEIFSGCTSLQEAPIVIELQRATAIDKMFYQCTSMTSASNSIIAPVARTATEMFSKCTSLQEVGNMILQSVVNITAMFSECSSLMSIGSLEFTKATTTNSAFYNCKNLRSVGTITFSTSMGNIFSGCTGIETLYYPKCTNGYASGAQFPAQTLLRTVTGDIDCYNTANAVTNLTNSPYISGVLTLKAPRAAITISNRGGITGIRIKDAQATMNNLTVTNCGMTADAINQLFTDLPTISAARTVSVVGNPGASSCNASIARNKGWIVVTA